MKKAGNVFVFLLLLLGCSSVLAEVKVQATVDRNQLGLGEVFTLKVDVTSDETLPVNEPSLPTIPDVQLIHNWVNSSTRSSVVSTGQGIDFKTVRSKIFSYQFTTQSKGKILIEPITVDVGGKQYLTKEITIQVLEPGSVPAPQARRPGRPPQPQAQPKWPRDPIDELEERFNQLLNRQFGNAPGAGGFMTEPRNANEAFFILAEVDKTEAFKGEQITAAWYLYTRGRVRDIDTLKYPTLKGFWKEDIQISTHLNFEQDVVNGIPYNRALLASYALFPIEEGKTQIDPYKAKATIVGGFGFGKGYQATKASDNIPILIKPVPEEGKPEDFTGAVGEFQMMVDAPNKSIVAHQPFPIKVRFEGRGNAKLFELPKLPLGDKLEVYDIKNESKFFKNGQSFKQFEVLLIPREPGELVFEGLKASFFNPKTEEYVSLSSEPIRLQVLPGTKQASIGEERIQSDIKKKTLPAIATQWDPEYEPSGSSLIVWFVLFGLGALGLFAKLLVDLGLFSKPPSLEEVINRRFSKIEQLVAKKQVRKAGIEVTNTVYYVLGEISGLGGSSEELDKVLAKTAPSVRREIEEPLRKIMDFFGVLGFGPQSYVDSFSDFSTLKSKTEELKKLLNRANHLSKGSDFSNVNKTQS